MTRSKRGFGLVLGLVLGLGVLGSGVLAPAQAEPPAAPAAPPAASAPRRVAARTDTTSAQERRRVDRVPAPKLHWSRCYGSASCATVKLPRDYDRPHGPTVKVALLKRPAKHKSHKIGTLFVNPGGPGGSGVELAFYAPYFMGKQVLDRFDVVGFDPRGTNASSQLRCFASARKQAPVADRLRARPFPMGAGETKRVRNAVDRHAKACSTRGQPLAAAVSTAEVARDLDVLRRAVGDRRLSYLGFSYGSYLGQVYANLFPDRVRAVAIDGVVDPLRWAGRASTAATPIGDRLRSADASWKALLELLLRCQQAGSPRCAFAAKGDPLTNFDLIARRLQVNPITDQDPLTGERFRFGYSELVGAVLGSLYSEFGYADIDYNLTQLYDLTTPGSNPARARSTASVGRLQKRLEAIAERQQSTFAQAHLGYPYDNSDDAFAAISCSDSMNAANLSRFDAIGAAADRRAGYFGRLWLWNTAQCSSKQWRLKDEDSYRAGFGRRTARAVLIVGNYWDPATNYAGAQTAGRLLPNSRLLSSDSWGHTAYNTSDCVTGAVDRYLVSGRLPATGSVCRGDVQPFARPGSTDVRNGSDRKNPSDLGLLRIPGQVDYTRR